MNTRIAPSPTGYFHMGTARTAYFNFLVAKATGGSFLLRIDDTDTSRNDDAYYKCIFDTFDWLDLKYDNLLYQSKRLDFYHSVASQMVDKNRATKHDDGSISMIAPTMPSFWQDSIIGSVKVTDDDLKNLNFTIIKSNGMPTYNFASIIDDVDTHIDWIIRGVDHIKNTVKQIAVLINCDGILNVPNFKFTHVGLIHHDVGGKLVKMSKRDGALGVLDYRDKGYDNNAFLNHIFKLGWGHSDPLFDKKYKTISKADAIGLVLQGKFRNVASTHDVKKLDSLQRLWMVKNAPVV